MKKTNSMRVAVAMLALTLITSCFVGGTFAKYVTSAKDEDVARVAKFGVKIDAGSSAFLNEYEADDNGYTAGVTVSSSGNVVAPGTSGEIELFKISGTPEVAVKVDVEMSEIQSIYLKAGTKITFTVNVEEWDTIYYDYDVGLMKDVPRPIPDSQEELEALYNKREQELENDSWLTGNPVKKTEEEDIYYPIQWSLIKDGDAANPVATGNLEDIKAYIDENINGIEVEPGKDLATEIGGSYKLTWSWSFGGNDENDTILGDIQAGTNTSLGEDKYNLNESFKFTITVTQID